MPFTRTPENALLRNAKVLIKLTNTDTLTDIGLVANCKVNFKPVNQDGNSGSNTIGYDVQVAADFQQTATTDTAMVMQIPGKELAQVEFLAEDDKVDLTNFMLNPDGTIDLSGGESKWTMTGHKKMSATTAETVHTSVA
jgi:hypothetical protein